jgi:FlaA1/EpsC-like NDP-sugar epimerase
VEYLQYSVNFYRDIKKLLINKYKEMEKNSVNSVLFYGAGEVAELAYLYLQLTNIRLIGIIDDEMKGRNFFGLRIAESGRIRQMEWDMVLLTRLEDTDEDIKNLLERGIDPERIATI